MQTESQTEFYRRHVSYFHFSVFGLMYRLTSYFFFFRNVIFQRCYYDFTINNLFRLLASNKGKLPNQNAAYKVIALE